MLADARTIIQGVEAFKARANAMSGGLEPELSVAIDVMFPISAVTTVSKEFALSFPATPLRLCVQALGGVAEQVANGTSAVGIVGSLPDIGDDMLTESLFGMLMVMVAAPTHPLALITGEVSRAEAGRHTQVVLTDMTNRSSGRSFGVMSADTWKVTDLATKHALLRSGLGWGSMPIAVIESDIATGELVVLAIEGTPGGQALLPMSVVYPAAAPPGPAGRWFIEATRRCSLAYEKKARATWVRLLETTHGGRRPRRKR